jgi:hypothetical protein
LQGGFHFDCDCYPGVICKSVWDRFQ